MARTRVGRTRLNAATAIGVADHLRPVPVGPRGAELEDDVAQIPMPIPSMRGLEATVAIASLAAALFLGLLR